MIVPPSPMLKALIMKAADSIGTKEHSPGSGAFSCSDCPAVESCLAAVLPASRKGYINHSLCFRKKLAVEYALYRAGDLLSALYVIHTGSFKSQLAGENGRDYITGIHLPGELMGIEGIASGQHTRNVVALEESVVCVIPMGVLDELTRELPGVQRWFHRMLSREISAVTRDMTLLGCRKAGERVSAFLLGLSERLAALGRSPPRFDLRLTRREIASHLGLSGATVSRAFAHLGREGVISTRKQRVQLLDMNALKRWARGRMASARSQQMIYGPFHGTNHIRRQVGTDNHALGPDASSAGNGKPARGCPHQCPAETGP